MKVGIIQSSFLPWRGYFDFIASVDCFVFYDDVQFSKGSWRNRNRIKCREGVRWLTVPVRHNSLNQLIMDTEIDNRNNWRESHVRMWNENYKDTQFMADASAFVNDVVHGNDRTISELNIRLTRRICLYLGITTPMRLSTEFPVEGTKTERLINLLRAMGATSYLSGPSASAYLDKEVFEKAGIGLEYKSYDYEPYSQLWGGFEGAVTVLDLIANCGPSARKYLHSRSPNQVVVSIPT